MVDCTLERFSSLTEVKQLTGECTKRKISLVLFDDVVHVERGVSCWILSIVVHSDERVETGEHLLSTVT